ncbi:putative ATP-dependent RNA helicase DDX4 [Nymphon striatum]|nr:putative ATP-dependent RNA helicase DDX4 [Nymphon striatum]
MNRFESLSNKPVYLCSVNEIVIESKAIAKSYLRECLKANHVNKARQQRALLHFELKYKQNLYTYKRILRDQSETLQDFQQFNEIRDRDVWKFQNVKEMTQLKISETGEAACSEILQHGRQDLLRGIPFFTTLGSNVFKTILRYLQEDVILKGETLVDVGSKSHSLYFIEHGSVIVDSAPLNNDGSVVTLNDGDYFGELFVTGEVTTYPTITAIENCEVYSLKRIDFKLAFKADTDYYCDVLRKSKDILNLYSDYLKQDYGYGKNKKSNMDDDWDNGCASEMNGLSIPDNGYSIGRGRGFNQSNSSNNIVGASFKVNNNNNNIYNSSSNANDNDGWNEDEDVSTNQYSSSNYNTNYNSHSNDTSNRDKGSCFNCGESGHMSRECPNPKKGGGNDRGCFNCGESGHMSRECPNPKKSGGDDRGCFNCGENGHMSRECPNPKKGGGNDRGCFNCGESGHMSRECPNPKKSGGDDRGCFNCGESGHMSRDCPNPKKSGGNDRGCFNCGESGHMSRECPNPKKSGGDDRGCFNCGESGHMSRECPNPKKSGGNDRVANIRSRPWRPCFYKGDLIVKDTGLCGDYNFAVKVVVSKHRLRISVLQREALIKFYYASEQSGKKKALIAEADSKLALFEALRQEGFTPIRGICINLLLKTDPCSKTLTVPPIPSQGLFPWLVAKSAIQQRAHDHPCDGRGCFKCGEDGHMAKDCPNPGDGADADKPPASTYEPEELPDDEEHLFQNGINSGIHFDKYDKIPVKMSGSNTVPAIASFNQAKFDKRLQANVSRASYVKLTPIQKCAIPVIAAGRDLMGCAQTGSGKTAAFLLPIINNMLNERVGEDEYQDCQDPSVIIVAPTRELALQIHNEAKKFAFRTSIKSVVIYGGTAVQFQLSNLSNGFHILVATPGRLMDFIDRKKASCINPDFEITFNKNSLNRRLAVLLAIGFENLKFLVLDEADRMLDMGFMPDVKKLVAHAALSPVKRQTLMFSATFPSEVQNLAREFLDDYIFLSIGQVGGANSDVTQSVFQVGQFDKRKKLIETLNESPNDRTLVFVGQKRTADFIATYLCQENLRTTSIHGDRPQKEREEALADFRAGRRPILVATAVAARGLDIKGVQHVINYDMPSAIDEYVHRIGRTGRMGNEGKATSFYDSKCDSQIARSFVKILSDSQQEVPDWLQQEAGSAIGTTVQNFGGGGGGRSQFGAKDVRAGQNDQTENFESVPDDEDWG